jgi:hypothetical protein
MRTMMKKQMVPLCLRCFIFIGIFMVLGVIYSEYTSGLLPFPILIFGSGWLALYVIFSFYFAFVIWGIKKLTGVGTSSTKSAREIMNIVSPVQPGGLRSRGLTPQYEQLPKKDSWKDRIEE